MMDVFSAIQGRRSIRKYSSKPIEEEKLNKILEAGRLAPSANNRQSWKFIVVRDPEKRDKLMEAAGGQAFVGEAPAVLIACGTEPDSIMTCGQHRYTVDLSIAMSFMVLEAYEQGIGTCWLGHFDEEEVKKILGIPKRVRVVAMTPLGYADEKPAARPRKSFDDVVCFDQYHE
jgi:nitroreductase